MQKTVKSNPGAPTHTRAGSITPMVVFALLVVMCCLALVLDRMWLDSSVVELTRGAEAAALKAAQCLASDDRLRAECDPMRVIEAARREAADIAAQNHVCGVPLRLEADDIHFDQPVDRSQNRQNTVVESHNVPTSVTVTAERSRGRGNPIALMFIRLTRQSGGDAVARVTAAIGNQVVGVRSFDDVHVPALPMAILEKDASGKRRDTWELQIEQRNGADRFAYDPETGQVVVEPDGIPEIVLHTESAQSSNSNVLMVDLGNRLQDDAIVRQIRSGLSAEELDVHGGELRLGESPIRVDADATFSNQALVALKTVSGQCRICMLYQRFQPSPASRYGFADCTRIVAGRIMSVQSSDRGVMQIIFQPGVIATRTALLADAEATRPAESFASNRYIFKLFLTQ